MTQRSTRRGVYSNDRNLSKYETKLEASFRQKYVYTASTDDTSTLAEVPDIVIIPDQDNSSTAIVLPLTYFDEDKLVEVISRETTETVTVGGVSCLPGLTTTLIFGGSTWAVHKVESSSTSAATSNVQRVATGTLTTAEIKDLNATPITLIAAPGASKALIIDEVQLFLDYEAADYVADAGDDLRFQYATSNSIVLDVDTSAISFLTASADAHLVAKTEDYYSGDGGAASGNDGVLVTGFDNEALEVTIAGSEVTTGDSPIKWKITYRTIDYLT